MDQEEMHISKQHDKSVNRDEASYQLPHIYEYLQRHLVNSHSEEGSSGC